MIIGIDKIVNIYIVSLCIVGLMDIIIVCANRKITNINNYYFIVSTNYGVVTSSFIKLFVLLLAIYFLSEPSPGIRAWPIIIAAYLITVLKMLISLRHGR